MHAIYHIKHVETLAGIVTHGGIWCDRECQRQNIAGPAIGYTHIKQRRMRHPVPLPPGGTLGDYVPFYFAPRSPMLYVINKGTADYDGGQEPVVHLVSSAESVAAAHPPLQWLFTDGHAVVSLSDYHSHLRDLEQLDWEIMKEGYWADTNEDNDRERRRQAEFLVHRFFPWNLVTEIGVCNDTIARRAQELMAAVVHRPPVFVRPEWYY